MADYVLERRLWLPGPRHEVFAFLADARNLALASSPPTRLRWPSPPPPLAAGAVIDFSVRMAGLPIRWRVFVREFDPPHRFVDAALWGPFARWEHRHTFRDGPEMPGQPHPMGTWVEDRVTYRLPLGAIGHLAHALVVGRSIAGRFDDLERRLREMWSAAATPTRMPAAPRAF